MSNSWDSHFLCILLKANAKCLWSLVCPQAFQNFKSLLCCALVLAAPCLQKPFKLQLDANHMGAGAVLLQSDSQGVDKPVSFFSRKFNIVK